MRAVIAVLLVIVGSLIVSEPASAAIITIDGFCSGGTSLSGLGTQSSEAAVPTVPNFCDGAIGGVRYASYTATGTPGDNVVLQAPSGVTIAWLVLFGSAAVSQMTLGWDGLDDNALGANGTLFDLTAAGLNPRLKAFVLGPAGLQVQLIMASGNVEHIVNTTANVNIDLPLTAFGALNPAAVQYIAVRVLDVTQQFPNGDPPTQVSIAPLGIEGTDPPSVPEPATIGLVTLGLAGLVRARQRRVR